MSRPQSDLRCERPCSRVLGVEPELESATLLLYEIVREILPPESPLVTANFGVGKGSGRVLKLAFGETSMVNSVDGR